MLVCANSNQPWNSTLPMFGLLPRCKTQSDVNQIHARLITTGFINKAALTTKLILSFCSSPYTPLVQFARHLFFSLHAGRTGKATEFDPFLWNAVIKSYSHGDDPEGAVVLFASMLENGVCVDKFSFSLVMKACSRMGLIKEGMQIHGLLRKYEIGSEVFVENCLVCLYLRCGCLEFARRVFDRMPKRDSVSFNLMIDGYVKSGMIDMARELFDCMPLEIKNLITWNSMISGYAQSVDGFKIACKLFGQMPEKDLISWNLMIQSLVKCRKVELAHALFNEMPERDVISWANMIDGYAKLGSVDIARALFDKMPERDVISCNVMMTGYLQTGYWKEALKLFHDMKSESTLSPDETTLSIALSAIGQLGQIDEGLAIHCLIKEHGFSLDGKLGVALIDMYSKCGSIENAMCIFEDVEGKRVEHWNAMICGMAIQGWGEAAFELFMEMERLSIKPDDITFIGILNACGHSGLVKEGIMCFELMQRVHRLEPKLQHYGCMVDILSRAGYIEVATKFIDEMPVEPNDVVWRTLLVACKNHNNLNTGEMAAKHLIGLDSCSSTNYVLLSNMYAGYAMWEDVRKVRTVMKERDLKKIPGCSWIELEGVVHKFFAGDKSHPLVGDIYSMSDRCSIQRSPATASD
ncbi:pentatricopeptide repeat-containing protein At2g45350, chloroplastic [Diospyros lotus]|uniref:pentatricopeptide repeat-containing protein At2g45350, chloroplastic n=1 Tax=Diospyros lotus TaxID=55363 RepID=UPI00224D73C4|nr:pentatricopeptide repeat-containing protein At2g45350, chloroplastic [Diospyros lotus]XP_052191677.1 pentatricopeptide repeat-containing protein At2g45350, chloroplastic [Diospyros lotus]XP_052191678.1 pentatricopeptide repeat-containing protein At2g45350, chloroplastic [Diospyros lotus]XP_052191679.1 pentatricopeptide repeat-containing protein At2g45350, chloroplastic [Diospyros lotus]XP_052191680.1 pentatricopeptide repeat-containing protein At2g45350, chloroplastic [Diospyros lotus]